MNTSLDLASERRLAIQKGSTTYKFTLQRITAERWQKYFDGIVSFSERSGGSQMSVGDAESPLLALVSDALVSAEGYKTADDKPIADVENWQALIPTRHRMWIGQILTGVTYGGDDSDEEAIVLGSERVVLEAPWNLGDDGKMQLHQKLVHNFNSPSIDHERRYMRDRSRAKIVGGSRTSRTIWPGVQRTLVTIYDELIQSVEGYCYGSDDLSAPGHIVQYMDTYHKVVAARALFTAESPEA